LVFFQIIPGSDFSGVLYPSLNDNRILEKPGLTKNRIFAIRANSASLNYTMTPVKYNLLIILRVLLIALMLFVFLFSLRQQAWYMTATVSGVLVPVLLAELIWFLHRKDRELARFLMAIRQKDFTGYDFTPENNKDSRLHEAFREIIREFNTVRIEKEVHYQYLQAIVDHVRIALISMDTDGRVEFFNREAGTLLGIKLLRNIYDLMTVDPELPAQIRSLRPGKAKLIRLNRGGEMLHLSLSSNNIRLRDRELVLLSLQDIRNALDEQELESWKKLIKILRHEIMNSVTPVTSLSAAMNRMLQQDVEERNDGGFLPAGELEDLRNSMQTIEKRSKGLLKFVDTYRTLTKIPKPVFRETSVNELIDHVLVLLGKELEGIAVSLDHGKEDLCIQADPDLLGQVLINILINARDALKDIERPEIIIRTGVAGEQVYISVQDNGNGMDAETLTQAFIPFFTTKKEGSGIGLSLSRQIMQLHKGSIDVRSEPGKGTTVVLGF